MSKQIVIIGAGAAGCSLAARLKYKFGDKINITVVEKQHEPGGRVGRYEWNNYRWDTGASLLLMKEWYQEAFQACGLDLEKDVSLVRCNPNYTVHFADDWGKIKLSQDIGDLCEQLELKEKGASHGLIHYLEEGYRHYTNSIQVIGKNYRTAWEFFKPSHLPLVWKTGLHKLHYPSVASFFKDPHLKAAFTFQDMYLGVSPFDAPSLFSLLEYTELVHGIWYPQGGMRIIIDKLVERGKQLGVNYLFDHEVKKVNIDSTETYITGIETINGKTIEGDIVVCNADLPYAFKNLLPNLNSLKKAKDYVSKQKTTSSCINFYWALDAKYDKHLSAHNVFLDGDFQKSFEKIFKEHTLPEPLSFYIHCPTRVDTTASPEGGDTLMVLIPIGCIDEKNTINYDEIVTKARKAVLDRLEKEGIIGIEKHIIHEHIHTPQTWKDLYNLDKGSTFGLSHNTLQLGWFRPANKHPNLNNLYFCGASTHPGGGVPIVLASAKLVHERIEEDFLTIKKKTKQPLWFYILLTLWISIIGKTIYDHL